MATGWARAVTDREIRDAVGQSSFLRAVTYVRQGRVFDLRAEPNGQVLMAKVKGAAPTPYRTVITAEKGGDGSWWSGHCSCPIGGDCKHVAAVILAAREAHSKPGQPALRGWERSVAELLGDTDRVEVGTAVPLALQFELSTTPQVNGRARGPGGPSPAQPRVSIRPAVPGKNGGWIRTGVSWRDLQYEVAYLRRVPAHRAALLALFRANNATSDPYYYRANDLYLHDFGPALWPLLDQLVDAGVLLVPAKGTPGPIVLAGTPADVELDLRRARSTGPATLEPLVSIGGARVDPAATTFLGDPAHGLLVDGAAAPLPPDAGAGAGLLLAPLAARPTRQLSRLVRGGQLSIPAKDVDRFVRDYYPGLRQVAPVRSSDDTVPLPEILPPRLALAATYAADHRVTLGWSFAYPVGDDVRRLPLHGPDAGTTRDAGAERRLLADLRLPDEQLPQLREPGPERHPASGVQLTGMDTVFFTEDMLPGLQLSDDVLVEVVGTPPDYRRAEAAPLVQVSTTEGEDADWFDLGVTVSVEDEDIPFQDLFLALARGDSHLVLDSGTYFSLERPELEQLRRLIEEARALQDRESEGLRISRYQVGLWEELTELGVVQAQSERWARSVQGLLDIDAVPAAEQPPGLAAELRPYQLEGYQWLSFLLEHELGGILADDMGLGKTLQTLAMVVAARDGGRLPHPMLVVAPTSVVPNWAAEAERFTPGITVVTVGETEARRATTLSELVSGADLVVTSYALFRIEEEEYRSLPWSGLVLDEAQFVKNHQAKTYQCARQLSAPFKLAITGTPLENSLMDLWSLLSIVAPGLFPSPKRFSEFYRTPIERGTDPELLATLRRRIRPLMRRRTKEQVATELPPKQEQVLEVVLNPRHQKIYQTHLQRERTKVLGLVDDLNKNRFTIFRSLTLLRQLSLDPALVDEKYAGVRASKVDVLLEHLAEVVGEGHRALVFSQFTGFLRTVRDRLDAEGVSYTYLDGRTRDRAKRIEEFKTGSAPVFLISLKAGGFGLNLTEADYVFVLDPWWNPAVEAQAVDRSHRIGQHKTVMVYRMVSTDTIEEKVMALKARKSDLFARVMDDDALLSAPLTAEDIRGLFAP
ncbi:Superfamily II DNA or RNA helicase, SNF2 family [Modestobacter sp. DSM 44400]|uniref:DEAD/DEAH box helicase n=1 Tax=Modestobacter sp. DSM 44400 TaxID=1550230 RepID=UPI0008943392|nr:SNF2-related protein [Modestobacter sp. DSM 44400]SDY38306.1 Superfamily II DNA or RNA helicase, SNF2 family [Modestobacter sp. DSM 44400]